MVCPVTPFTAPPIQSTSGVRISRLLIPRDRNVSQTISLPCYHGFVVPNLHLAFELNSIALQGTKVLENREIRQTFYRTSEDTPLQHVSPKVVKYTGALVAPEWEDIEPGIVFNFP